tara:strand:+ start:475 stop:705 length:231 start_codon:yes stop_codon:yes gene_type:complete
LGGNIGYKHDGAGGFAFHYNKAPTVGQLTEVLHTISQRVASFLERQGLLERDAELPQLSVGKSCNSIALYDPLGDC